ncbi:MAG: glycosyltransferase family protein [Patescibacteria group bacterium]
MNILYVLSGFGFGHAVRSRVVIEELKKLGHFVKIATYGQSIDYLKKFFPNDIVEIKGLKHSFLLDRLFATGTILKALKDFPTIINKNFPLLRKIIKNFQIDVVFNDFEPSSRWLARAMGIPLVTIDNQFLSYLCKLDVPLKFFPERFSINMLINFLYPWGDWRFVTSFVPELTPIKKHYAPNTFIVPPILRKEIFELKPKKEDFILVYQTAPIYKKRLFKVFLELKENFVCYNLGKPSRTRNIILKNFSEKEFLSDLSHAKAVIQNGGFTLMSEAIYLKKPVFSIPIKGDFEQILNGLLLAKAGYGIFCEKFNKKSLKKFLKNLPSFEEKLKKHQQKKNIIFEKKLLRVLNKIEYGS